MDLFDDIIGYNDLKEIIIGAVESEAKVHWLFHGPPASAKTMFILEMEDKIPEARLTIGSRTTKSGLHWMLLTDHPKILLFDELDKSNNTIYSSLLSLLETGRIIITQKSISVDEYIGLVMFATANRLSKIPPELLSRFQLLEFPAYTEEEFMNICRGYIAKREKIKINLAEYIGERVWNFMEIRDVRQVIRIARLAKTRKKVDLIIKVLKRYSHYPSVRYGYATKYDDLETALRWEREELR